MPFLEYLYINVFQAVLFYFNYHCIQLSGRPTWLSSYFRKYIWIWGRVVLSHKSENCTTSFSLPTNLTQNLSLRLHTYYVIKMYQGERRLSITNKLYNQSAHLLYQFLVSYTYLHKCQWTCGVHINFGIQNT